MTIENKERFQVLSKIVDTTFGKSSTTKPLSPYASVKLSILDDDVMKASFMMIVNFDNSMMKNYHQEAISKIEAVLKNTKEKYKEETGKTINLSIDSNQCEDSIEWLSYSFYNPKRTAYFRLKCIVKIS